MQETLSKLWVFGDSFTSPNYFVEPQESFWGLAAQELGVDRIVNCSRAGNSFETVLQQLIGLSTLINFEQDTIFVGIPPLGRQLVFDNGNNTQYWATVFDLNGSAVDEFEIAATRGLMTRHIGDSRQEALWWNSSLDEVRTMREVFLIDHWLSKLTQRYLVLNLSRPFDSATKWAPATTLVSNVQDNPHFIIFDKTYYSINYKVNRPADSDKYGWHGHHGPAGNLHYYKNAVLPKLKELNLC